MDIQKLREQVELGCAELAKNELLSVIDQLVALKAERDELMAQRPAVFIDNDRTVLFNEDYKGARNGKFYARPIPAQQSPAVAVPEFNGWYCAQCQCGVDPSEVTFHETHTVCGRYITDDVPPTSPRITEQDCPTYDIDKMAWHSIKLAANESEWMPREYCMNDWVSDVCAFLRRRPDRVTEQDAREIANNIFVECCGYQYPDIQADAWLEAEGRAVINKLNEARHE